MLQELKLAAAANLFFALVASSGCAQSGVAATGASAEEMRVEKGKRETPHGSAIRYTLFLPPADEERGKLAAVPVVILVHGFARDHSRHVGTAEIIARRGMAVLVPDMTTLMTGELGRRQNVENMIDHLGWLKRRNADREDALFRKLDLKRIGMAGHSAGGGMALETAVATAGTEFEISAVVLLDGVPWRPTLGRIEKGDARAPLLSIRADKSKWNANGFVKEAEERWKGAVTSIHLKGTSHIDPENPPDPLGDRFLKASPPERRRHFWDLTATFLAAELARGARAKKAYFNLLAKLEDGGDPVEQSERDR